MTRVTMPDHITTRLQALQGRIQQEGNFWDTRMHDTLIGQVVGFECSPSEERGKIWSLRIRTADGRCMLTSIGLALLNKIAIGDLVALRCHPTREFSIEIEKVSTERRGQHG
jgi:hypothetical protein